ncbi:acyltransferase domain-containing protein [Barrientosiimonas humi]|uniref:acyltransferase domain-containing protein n=1 Tax=Barrientosiimonas humi TaxID=999931 RepID=UPI00370DCC0A
MTPEQIADRLALDRVRPLLDPLAVEPDDAAELMRWLPTLDAADHARVATAADAVLGHLGVYRMPDPDLFAAVPDEAARPPGLLRLAALLASVPEVRAFHADRGIPDADSWTALSLFGVQLRIDRAAYDGTFGLRTALWLTAPWSGALYWLGRLQLNLFDVPEQGRWLSAHIPRTGPLDPGAVDASFARAYAFFDRHFPDLPVRGLHCRSWLLDPQLLETVAPESNIARFQQRWRLTDELAPGNADALYFTFALRGDLDLERLPQETSLQRGIVGRVRGGGEWHVRTGTIPR